MNFFIPFQMIKNLVSAGQDSLTASQNFSICLRGEKFMQFFHFYLFILKNICYNDVVVHDLLISILQIMNLTCGVKLRRKSK